MWKTMLKHCIYQSKSGVRVYENICYRWLTFNSDAIQSMINRRNPQIPVLKYIQPLATLVKRHPGDSCLLGLGGGAFAHYIAYYMQQHKLTAVEKNKEVIETADWFFMINEIKNLHIVHFDAFKFIQTAQQTYRHIIVDLYNAYSFPAECSNDDFFQGCKNRLQNKGFLAVNLASPNEQYSIYKVINQQFDHRVVTIPLKNCSNVIIFACKNASYSYLVDEIRQCFELKALYWDNLWGYVAEISRSY